MSNPRKQLGSALESRVVEKAESRGLTSKKQPLSGALKGYPNDVVIEDVLAECKVRSHLLNTKGQRYIRLELDWLAGVEENAKKEGFDAGVLVVNAKHSPTPKVLVDLDFFLDLLRIRKETQNGTYDTTLSE